MSKRDRGEGGGRNQSMGTRLVRQRDAVKVVIYKTSRCCKITRQRRRNECRCDKEHTFVGHEWKAFR